MTKETLVPKNFSFVITVTVLGLVLISILIFLYNSFVLDNKSVDMGSVNGGDGGTGIVEEGKASDGDDLLPSPPIDRGDSGAKNESEQKVVKTGSFDITVDDFDDVSGKIRKYAKELGGFVVSSNDQGVGVDRTLVMTIKVPATAFDSLTERVKGYASVVNSFTESSSDITLQYQDLKARLKNEKALETKLVEILDLATKVTDILEVQNQLSQTRQNIEVLESQIKYYDSQIEMSSVTISMSLSSESLEVTGEKWQPVGIFKEALTSLVELFKDLGSLAIWAVVFSPVVFVIYLVAKYITKRVVLK
ncbi:DUF4349 domain-containing protein [Candidatus Dojkabacteria bacterium]|nr:DUF4349 domain-containing protein [Candidatus Dojkabacteria bacterium]